MSTKPCWRCYGRGDLGKLPGGAPLICRLCHGVGRLPDNAPLRLQLSRHPLRAWLRTKAEKARKALRGWVKRNWICDEDELWGKK